MVIKAEEAILGYASLAPSTQETQATILEKTLQVLEASQTLPVQPYSQGSPVGTKMCLQMMALYQLYSSHDGMIATNPATSAP